MNENKLITDHFSNPDSQQLYFEKWPAEPQCRNLYESGQQCGGCSFFAELNFDYGICCNQNSRHYTETVFEHFTCPAHVNEGWGPHSFTEDREFHCRCGGKPVENDQS